MKRFLYLITLIALLSACEKDDSVSPIFEKTANERMEELKTFYINELIDSPEGWVTYYAPSAKHGGFRILMKFDKDGNVEMASDYNQGLNNGKSLYRIDKTLKAELIFETESIFAKITEIGRNGVHGEFQFNIIDIKDNKIFLESKTDNGYGGDVITKITLEKASAEDWDFSKIQENTQNITQGHNTDKYYRTLQVAGTEVKANVTYQGVYDKNQLTRYFIIKREVSKNKIEETINPIAITPTGFKFITPININDKEVSNFSYNSNDNSFISKDGGQTTIINYTDKPAVEYFPGVSVGENPNDSFETGFYEHFLFNQIMSESSAKFKALWKDSGFEKIFINYNTDEKGTFSEKKQAVLLFLKPGTTNEYYKIPLKIKRIPNKRLYFSVEGDVANYVTDADVIAKMQPIINVITSSEGFYVEAVAVDFLGILKSTLYIFTATNDSSMRIAFLKGF